MYSRYSDNNFVLPLYIIVLYWAIIVTSKYGKIDRVAIIVFLIIMTWISNISVSTLHCYSLT